MKDYSNQEIKKYVEGLDDFQKEIVNTYRSVILNTDDRIKEGMKWGSVAFFNQKNICGFRVAKQHVTLLFMEGASLNDQHQILEGSGSKARTVKVKRPDEINIEAIRGLVLQALEAGM